ncbi:MAG: LemA family protein, partial [Planctomycetes bacterium]|nr:LemA family protein [Planctomycetota bacterium]
SGELTNTENVISSSRGAFNEAVREYNSYREGFPAVILAGMFNFQPAAFFEIENATEREAPKVSFS